MAKKIDIKVLRDTNTYEQLLPSTIAEQVTYSTTQNVKEAISSIESTASEASTKADAAQTSVDTLSNQVSGIASTVSTLGTTVASQGERLTQVETKVENNITIINNSVVATTDWSSDTSYTDYPYKANITIANCTTSHVPDVYFGLTDAVSGKFAPIASSYNGGVSIWATEVPEASITIPTIKLIKQS